MIVFSLYRVCALPSKALRAKCRERDVLFDVVQATSDRHNIRFHVPGHKGRSEGNRRLDRLLQEYGVKADLTELPGLDNLAQAEGPIAAAQQRASRVFGAWRTFFLVNGSSGGLHAAVGACCPPGTVVVASRASHSSVYNAAALAGVLVCPVEPEMDARFGIAHGMPMGSVRRALQQLRSSHHTVSAVVATSPTYFGACIDVAALAQVCAEAGVVLIVDEAHGSHLGLDASLPRSALQQGATIAVQSTHKTLGALTQAAMLHVSHSAPAGLDARVQEQLLLLQSTSPSYLLMASLDSAVGGAQASGAFDAALSAATLLRSGLRSLDLPVLGCDCAMQPETVAGFDPLRVSCLVSHTGTSGYQLLEQLYDTGVAVEMATESLLVFALGIGSIESDTQQALEVMQDVLPHRSKRPSFPVDAAHLQQDQWHEDDYPCVDARAVMHRTVQYVPWHAAEGQQSATHVSVYPPGIPVVLRGEIVTPAAAQRLDAAADAGAHIVGCDAAKRCIAVCSKTK